MQQGVDQVPGLLKFTFQQSRQMNLQTSCLMLGDGTEVVRRRGHSGWVDGQGWPF